MSEETSEALNETMSDVWRIVLVDDHSVVRAGLRHVLEADVSVEVVGEAATAADGVRVTQETQPDLVILDLTMPGASGLAIVGRLREVAPATRVLILSMHADPEYVREAERLGTSGYVLKDDAAAELPAAIAAVRRGDHYRSAKLAGTPVETSANTPSLTPRERDVLRGIARGQTNKEMANALGISHRTVETHRENVMRKLGIHTVAGLTRYALDYGFAVVEKTR